MVTHDSKSDFSRVGLISKYFMLVLAEKPTRAIGTVQGRRGQPYSMIAKKKPNMYFLQFSLGSKTFRQFEIMHLQIYLI